MIIIYDHEFTFGKNFLTIYIHDGNFLRWSFYKPLESMSNEILQRAYSMHTLRSCSYDILSDTCYAGSIMVKKSNGYKNIIDLMYDVDSTVGGFVLNRELDRCHILLYIGIEF